MKYIIAIDPGPKTSGIVMWDGSAVYINPEISNPEMLSWLRQGTWVNSWVVAIEMIACYGMPVGAETFETCLIIGRIQEICKSTRIELIYRKEVKMHLCGSMKAKDANIRKALIDKLGEVGIKKNPGPLYGISGHSWSALAIAITCAETKS